MRFMAELELAYLRRGEAIALDRDEIVLGRSSESDLVLNHRGVSRRHAKIVRRGDDCYVVDLGSRNGTQVNGKTVTEAPIHSGDRITLGETVDLEVREYAAATLVDFEFKGEDPADVQLPPEGAIYRPAEDLEKLLRLSHEQGGSTPPIDQIESRNRILRILGQVGKALISTQGLDEMLEKVMDLVFEHIPAERGVLGLYEGERIVPRVVRSRAGAEGGGIRVPQAITQRVLEKKVSILTTDALADDRFGSSESIVLQSVRSAMCVPLWDEDRVIGTIYVDEDMRAGIFSPGDLDLLAALGNYSTVAIERARLTAKIQEEQLARSKLERYHSPGVVEMIIKGADSENTLSMQNKDVSVSFTDMVGFTTLSEVLEPAELGRLLNEFFTEMSDCIFAFGGTLDKYIGDCIMAVFGAPLDMPDHALRSVRAALAMHGALKKLQLKTKDIRIDIRTAINSGPVVAGDLGSPKRKDYSVLGDTVNVASRLESAVAKPGQIVIGESTYRAVRDYFEVEHLGAHSLKGKKRKMNAYQVIGEKPGAF